MKHHDVIRFRHKPCERSPRELADRALERASVTRGKVAVAEALLAGGVDPCIRDAQGFYPYSIATEGGPIHRALDRARGHDLVCQGQGEAISLDSSERRRIQEALAGAGFDPGPADGQFGPRTRQAIEAWQQANGHTPTGELTSGQVDALLADAAALESFGPNWSIVENQPCQVWNFGKPEKFEPYIWSGACVDGKASGEGRPTVSGIGASYQGSMAGGQPDGAGGLWGRRVGAARGAREALEGGSDSKEGVCRLRRGLGQRAGGISGTIDCQLESLQAPVSFSADQSASQPIYGQGGRAGVSASVANCSRSGSLTPICTRSTPAIRASPRVWSGRPSAPRR